MCKRSLSSGAIVSTLTPRLFRFDGKHLDSTKLCNGLNRCNAHTGNKKMISQAMSTL